MRKVQYTGLRPKGTITPRIMWRPGDVLELDEELAKEIARDPDFRLLRKPKPKEESEEKEKA